MSSAAPWPAAMALMTVLGPVTASPPAKNFALLVWEGMSSLTSKQDHLLTFTPLSAGTKERSGVWPMAAITVSTLRVNSEPGMATGRLRPLESKSPSFWRRHSTPVTRPLEPTTRSGAMRYSILMPSCSAARISSAAAGMSSRRRR